MLNEQLEVIIQPTTAGFLEFLEAHAGVGAPLGQWGFYPEAHGDVLSMEQAMALHMDEKWIGRPAADANALVEIYVNKHLKEPASVRIKHQYDEWCYGHIGNVMSEMVQLPGGAVFKVDAEGNFTDVAYLRNKTGNGPLDWDIYVCNDSVNGLCVEPMNESYTHWGLVSMVMRYNVPGPLTAKLATLPAGAPYGVVWSSVLNFRSAEDRHLVSSLPNGTVVALTGVIDGDWTQCMVGGVLGYVFSKFLVKHNL